jgi:hypothetical protein
MFTDKKLRIVVEGVGHVVQNYYVKGLKWAQEQLGDDISITFVDDSSFWRGNKRSAHIFRDFIKSLDPWALYIDKSKVSGERLYKGLRDADFVFIATPDFTHVKIAKHWLTPPRSCRQIFIEKPLDSSLNRARDLLFSIGQNDPKVRTLDHYRARVLPVCSELQLSHMKKDLGGRIVKCTFYFLENKSGPPSIGPIENEGRTTSVKNGLILDMVPHVPAILTYYGLVDTTRIMNVTVGRYVYTDNNGQKREATIPNETFAHVQFTMFDHELHDPPIQCDAYIGKGVRGVEALNMWGDVKLLEITGRNSKRYRLDLRSSGNGASQAYLIKRDGTKSHLVDLERDPYSLLMERIVRHETDDPDTPLRFDLPVETAKTILQSVDEMRYFFKRLRKRIPTYDIGKGDDDAPSLEELLKQLRPTSRQRKGS